MNTSENELTRLLTDHELTQGDLCQRCGYDIYQHRLGSLACVRCYPPRGFHMYSNQLDAIHPWRPQPIRGL